MQWDKTSTAIAFTMIPFAILTLFGLSAVISAGTRLLRRMRLLFRSQDGLCERLIWEDVGEAVPSKVLHRCTSPWCKHVVHVPGGTCWKDSIGSLFNMRGTRFWVDKPEKLKVQQSYLCTEPKVILAYIILTVGDRFPEPARGKPQVFDYAGLKITPQRFDDSSDITVHLDLPKQTDVKLLTKLEVDRLLKGYPPFYRERIICNGFQVPTPIRTEADLARGGWIIGVGLSSTTPIPLYVDNLHETYRKRGMIFWRSIKRVRDILQSNFLAAFPTDRNVTTAINAIEFMIETETQSGVDGILARSDIHLRKPPVLSHPDCVMAMNIFNEPPNLAPSAVLEFREKLEPMLFSVLVAAVDGVTTCVEYVKNPGREIDAIIPELLHQAKRVFVEGC